MFHIDRQIDMNRLRCKVPMDGGTNGHLNYLNRYEPVCIFIVIPQIKVW